MFAHHMTVIYSFIFIAPIIHVTTIKNGWPTETREYPFICYLQKRNPTTERSFCGASIVNEKFLLTAAHCVADVDRHDYNKRITIKCGKWNIRFYEDGERLMNVDTIFVNPRYYSSYGIYKFEYDIALIKLRTQLSYNHTVIPLTLAPENYESSAYGRIIGWGANSFNELTKRFGFPNELKFSDVQLTSYEYCNWLVNTNSLDMLCTPYMEDFFGCIGDSGSPLLDWNGTHWLQTGIFSFAYWNCEAYYEMNAFTRVSRFVRWINTIIEYYR